MEPILMSLKFSALLNRFFNAQSLSTIQLESCYDYLFNGGKVLKIENVEIRETIEYLKDLMYLNDLQTLDDVLIHFEGKRKNLSFFLSNTIKNFSQDVISIDNSLGAFIDCKNDNSEGFVFLEHSGVPVHFHEANSIVVVKSEESTNPTIFS